MSHTSEPTADEPLAQRRRANREYAAAHRKRLKAKGLCVNCAGRPTTDSHSLCDFCLGKLRAKRDRLKQAGLCRCGKRTIPVGRSCCDACRNSSLVADRKTYYRLKAEGLCTECRKPAASGFNRCGECRSKAAASRVALRCEAFDAYGGRKCACCGTSALEFLTLEHTANDGAKHRRQLSKRKRHQGGHWFYRKLKQLGFPRNPPMIVLCFNCNFSRALFGYCPCQKKAGQPSPA